MRTNSCEPRPDAEVGSGWSLEVCGALLSAGCGTLRPGGLELTDYALSLCPLEAGGRILDAGCGTGATVKHLNQVGKWRAVGVDLSPSLLGEGGGDAQALPLVRGRLESLPFRDACFDAVLCECVLSRTEASRVLMEFRRLLLPGGFLILSDLYSKSVPSPRFSGAPRNALPAGRETTLALLTDAGFETLHWEDRGRDLKRLAFRLIMEPGEAASNMYGWSEGRGAPSESESRAWWSDVGYHLLIARRRG